MPSRDFSDFSSPLSVDEVIDCIRSRWIWTYDLQLVFRNNRLYLQIMWAYLEQQSFPMDEDDYRKHLNEVLEVINRLGLASLVREWLWTTSQKPKLGRAVALHLDADERLKEFIVRNDQ